jgi:hypothetical protein
MEPISACPAQLGELLMDAGTLLGDGEPRHDCVDRDDWGLPGSWWLRRPAACLDVGKDRRARRK